MTRTFFPVALAAATTEGLVLDTALLGLLDTALLGLLDTALLGFDLVVTFFDGFDFFLDDNKIYTP